MATSSSTGLVSSLGVGSGLDLSGVITKLMSVEQQPLTKLYQKEASYQTKLTAYGSLQGALSTFQSAVKKLTDASQYTSLSASSSATSILTASANKGAQVGTHDITVSTLAQKQKLATSSVTDATASIGTGTLTFQFGTISGGTLTNGVYSGASFSQNADASTQTVTIDSSHSSLSGIRDAINSAAIGVTASLVNDGTGTRLVLSSDNSGAAYSMKVSASSPELATYLSYDPAGTQNMTQKTAAQNATLTVDGIDVTSASNTVTGAIENVTLNLLGTTSSSTTSSVSVNVSQSTTAAISAVNGFVTAYNKFESTLSDLTKYDSSTKTAGTLQGDFNVTSMFNQIKRTLTSTFQGLDGTTTSLASVGITFQKDGTLAADSAKLSSAITNNPNVFAGLFAATGITTDSLVSYVSSGDNAKPGQYAVNVTQLASQGSFVAGSAVGVSTTIVSGSNDALNLTVDGIAGSVTLDAGTYTQSQLVAQIQSKINGISAFSSEGIAVTVSQSSGVLTIKSDRYGSASNVKLVSGSSASTLGLSSGTSTDGVDVAGTIGGRTATGSGQYLTASAGGDVDAIKLKITGGSTGDRGTVTYGKGVAYQLDQMLTSMLSSTGAVTTGQGAINKSITSVQKDIESMNTRLQKIQAMYQAQFSRLDTLVAKLQQTQSSLTSALSSLSSVSLTGSSK